MSLLFFFLTIPTIITSFLYPPSSLRTPISCSAKKRNKSSSSSSSSSFPKDDLPDWYETVSSDSTPDDVFWEEMERQKLMTDIGSTTMTSSSSPTPNNNVGNEYDRDSSSSSLIGGGDWKSVEAVLASFDEFQVSDNFLGWEFDEEDEEEGEEERDLSEQLDDLEQEEGWEAFTSSGDEIWDYWGEEEDEGEEDENGDPDVLHVSPTDDAKEFLLQDDDDDISDEDDDDSETLERLKRITITSPRLTSASNNPKATAFFARPPDATEGYDRMWVSAVDEPTTSNLNGVFRNYGIQFADNFGDWLPNSPSDAHASIEDVASSKARNVYEVTKLPCIASRTSFEIEPIITKLPGMSINPRIQSGYRFNDVGVHVDRLCQSLLPSSSPSRITRFRTCLCYYDGSIELFEYGECDVDLYFANSLRTFIPMSTAINELCQSLQLALGLEYQSWWKSAKKMEMMGGVESSSATLKLRDRVLKEGKVLPNDIVDVSRFMDSFVDVNLMEECGKELAQRFAEFKPTKILTVATTGLIIAIPMAQHLQIPIVYARKERSIVMSQTYQASYSSKTMGNHCELFVSQHHLSEHDRVLVVDDFLSSGSSQEALLQIVSESGAEAVGIGVVLEKVYDCGRQRLSGYDLRVESVVRVKSVKGGIIRLVEEEEFRG